MPCITPPTHVPCDALTLGERQNKDTRQNEGTYSDQGTGMVTHAAENSCELQQLKYQDNWAPYQPAAVCKGHQVGLPIMSSLRCGSILLRSKDLK
jgi:hypothetical protein